MKVCKSATRPIRPVEITMRPVLTALLAAVFVLMPYRLALTSGSMSTSPMTLAPRVSAHPATGAEEVCLPVDQFTRLAEHERQRPHLIAIDKLHSDYVRLHSTFAQSSSQALTLCEDMSRSAHQQIVQCHQALSTETARCGSWLNGPAGQVVGFGLGLASTLVCSINR